MGYFKAAKNLYKFVTTGNSKYAEAVVGTFQNSGSDIEKALDDQEDPETILEGHNDR